MQTVQIAKAVVERRSPVGVNTVAIQNFELQRNDRCVLLGRSGSGKTSLLHVIAGLTAIHQGEVMVQGTAINTLSEAQRDRFRAKHIGIVFQNLQLIPALTVQENILLGAVFADNKEGGDFRAKELLVMLGIEHKAHSFPKQLSTGEQQRVAVARALINQPSLLLIDEPTANLDEANAVKVVERLVTVADNIRAALLIVTHDAVVAQSFRDHLHIEDYVTITTTS